MIRANEKSPVMANRTFYTGFPTSHQPRFYAALSFLKMGIKMTKFVYIWTTSTIKDEKSAAKFHYIKTLRDIVVAQSIAFRVVSIYWQGTTPSLKSWLELTYRLLIAASLDTFCLVAPQ